MNKKNLKTKEEIRRETLEILHRMLPEDRRVQSLAVQERVMALPAWRTARNVMTYLHMPHEVATHSLAQAVLVSGRQLVVPKCEGKRLGAWAIEDPERDLTPGPWGILEPRPGSGRRVAARDLDLIIVPGVAFDRQGNRLGYGRGYYDSFLPRAAVEAKIVGIAFREQIVDGVPHEPRDFVIPLLVTADGVIES